MLSTCVEVGPVVELDGSARRLRNTGVKTQQRSRAERSRERPLGHLQRRRRHIHRAVHVVVGEVDVERRRRCLDQPAPQRLVTDRCERLVWARTFAGRVQNSAEESCSLPSERLSSQPEQSVGLRTAEPPA